MGPTNEERRVALVNTWEVLLAAEHHYNRLPRRLKRKLPFELSGRFFAEEAGRIETLIRRS